LIKQRACQGKNVGREKGYLIEVVGGWARVLGKGLGFRGYLIEVVGGWARV